MRGEGALLGGETADITAGKRDGVRGGDVIRHHDGGAGDGRDGALTVVAHQGADDPVADVVEIGNAFVHVRAAHLRHHGDHLFEGAVRCPLGVHALVADDLDHLINEEGVHEQHEVRIKDPRFGGGGVALGLLRQLRKLVPRLIQRRIETRNLAIDRFGRDLILRRGAVPLLLEAHGGSERHTAGSGEPTVRLGRGLPLRLPGLNGVWHFCALPQLRARRLIRRASRTSARPTRLTRRPPFALLRPWRESSAWSH